MNTLIRVEGMQTAENDQDTDTKEGPYPFATGMNSCLGTHAHDLSTVNGISEYDTPFDVSSQVRSRLRLHGPLGLR